MNAQPFFHGEPITKSSPLKNNLPVYQENVVKAWLSNQSSRSGLVLCPFGSSPQVALEAASAGFRVVMPVHNPILYFLLNSLAQPPSREQLNSALSKLGSSYKGKERLKPHILSLYETDCPQCGGKTSASSFLWSRATQEPVSKTCRCTQCGEKTEGAVTADDLDKAREFQMNSPTHARALTRVAAPDDPIRFQVENALRSYPPRSVYAIFTALNKVTGFNLNPEESIHLETLMLHAFYRTSQPDHLSKLDSGAESEEDEFFREENVWYAFEEALDIWCEESPVIPVTTWPDLPPESGGVVVYPGRIRELIPQLKSANIHSVVMVFPKPNPSFWALSALWTGWLWGQDAAAPLKSILSIKNFDWSWMTRAIQTTLLEIKEILPPETFCFGLLPGLEIHSLISGISAASSAGFHLENLAVEPDHRLGQTSWSNKDIDSDQSNSISNRENIRIAGVNLLKRNGEPIHTLSLYAAGMAALAKKGFLESEDMPPDPDRYFPQLIKDFEENIAYRQGFLHFPKIDKWWHQELSLSPVPQSDLVEKLVVELLVKTKTSLPEVDIFQHVFSSFPGSSIPQQGLIKACLNSYAEKDSDHSSLWKLKSSEKPSLRLKDLEEIEEIFTTIGAQLGFQVTKNPSKGNIIHLIWKNENKDQYSFSIAASGLLSKILFAVENNAAKKWMILPGSRAELITYKMQHNPPLAGIIDKDWELIKYRHIRRLADQGNLSEENFLERLNLDPFRSDSPQLPLI